MRNDAGLWAHGNLKPARGLAEKLQLAETRMLLVMSVDGDELDAIASPGATSESLKQVDGEFTELSYAESVGRWGADAVEEAWLAVNNEAFSWHPEQGGWDRAQLSEGMQASWFDPYGVRFLWQGGLGEESAPMPKLAGFHWTKRHSETVGEVYVVGLGEAFRGRGLGEPLMSAGLEHLVRGGSDQVILYVEADNDPAVKRYRDMGFKVVEEHVVYARR